MDWTKDLKARVGEHLQDAEEVPVLPRSFLIAVQSALESGLSYEELVACITLHAAVRQIRTDRMEWSDLLRKAKEMVGMLEDIQNRGRRM